MPCTSIVTWRRAERPGSHQAPSADSTPGPAAEPHARRVLEDVLDNGVEVCVALDHAGLEPALKQVPAARVAPVEPHRVDPIQPLHPAGELGLSRLDEQMEVVVEQVPGVHPPAETPPDVEKELEPGLAVAVVENNRSLLDAAADDVVPRGTRQPAAWDSRHAVDATLPSADAKPA